ncbi:MAG TPA: hypothetical protein VGO47_09960 [Chlamydiales bacterium]|jgi:hypothetical protein|nr:hypothetical protein [Chlamydiales bacterium]
MNASNLAKKNEAELREKLDTTLSAKEQVEAELLKYVLFPPVELFADLVIGMWVKSPRFIKCDANFFFFN